MKALKPLLTDLEALTEADAKGDDFIDLGGPANQVAIFAMNDTNLRKWLRDPPKAKPGSVMPNLHLSEDEITSLIAYLDTLK